jgi:hypothetical protein
MTEHRGLCNRVRGSNVMVSVRCSAGRGEVRDSAVAKHKLCNSLFPDIPYDLRYPDGVVVQYIPGSSKSFTVREYKDFLGVPYQKMNLYVCPSNDSGLLCFLCIYVIANYGILFRVLC